MKINETFVSIQGEINVGCLAFFIRFSGCNLNCSYCDTKYANDSSINITDKELIEKAICFPRVVITGGEPFLQKYELAIFVEKLFKRKPDIIVEIETNGTLRPVGGIEKYKNIIYNVSPKLKNSGDDYKQRIKSEVISWFMEMNANFKFVVDDINDIDEVDMLVRDFGIKKSKVFLMAEGKTAEEQYNKMETIIGLAKLKGFNFTPRLQVLVWGNERGV